MRVYCLKTLATWRSTSPGFSSANVLVLDLWLPAKKFSVQEERTGFIQRVATRLREVPGVTSAAFVADLPLNGGSDSLGFRIIGRPQEKSSHALFNIVSAGYFKTLGIPLRAGREFTAADAGTSPAVVVINESAARRFWPGENPLERQITVDSDTRSPSWGLSGTCVRAAWGRIRGRRYF